jgi:hypothetical protein
VVATVQYNELSYGTRELQHLQPCSSHPYHTRPEQSKKQKMTSSIPIPATRNPNKQSAHHSHRTSSTSSASSYYPSYHHNSASTPGSSYASSHHHHQYSPESFVGDSSKSGKGKGKEREVDVDVVVRAQPRRASLLGM